MSKEKNPNNAKSFSQAAANKLRARALELVQSETTARFALAEVVHELYYGTVEMSGGELPIYQFFGHDSWFDYVETEIGLHVTTAAGYRQVHDVFIVKLGDFWDRSLTPSFTKLKALTRVVDARNVNAWLRKANKLSCCQLEEEIAVELHGKQRRGAHRHFTAFLTDRQLVNVNTILELAAEHFDVDTRGEALVKALEVWSAATRKGRKNLKLLKSA